MRKPVIIHPIYKGFRFLNKAPISVPIFLVRPISETANYIDVYALEGATDNDGDDLIISAASVTSGNVTIVRNDSYVRVNFGANEDSDVVVSYTIMDNGNPERSSTNTITVLSYSENILDYSPYHAWNSENITVDGTTTTLADINNVGTSIDLSNPAAINQPTYNGSSANFNSLPSLRFDGSNHYVTNNTSFRSGDSSGVFITVSKNFGALQMPTFTISDNTRNGKYFNATQFVSNKLRIANAGNSVVIYIGDTDISDLTAKVFVNANTGSNYKLWVNENPENVSMVAGANDGSFWLDDYAGWNNVSIGALAQSAIIYSDVEWSFSGYFPYVSDWEILKIIYSLKAKYGI